MELPLQEDVVVQMVQVARVIQRTQVVPLVQAVQVEQMRESGQLLVRTPHQHVGPE